MLTNFTNQIPTKRRRKIIDSNLHLMKGMEFENNFPVLKPFNDRLDFSLVSYIDRKKNSGVNQGLHFFLDDYRFRDPVWFNLFYVTYSISKFDYVFTPDLSLWRNIGSDFPNMNNIYRTRFIGAFWQQCGFKVIPTASWGGLNSFSYCFKGLPKNSVIAISGMGARKDKFSFDIWCYGIKRLEEDRKPSLILIYGDEVSIPEIKTPIKFLPTFISKNLRYVRRKK